MLLTRPAGHLLYRFRPEPGCPVSGGHWAFDLLSVALVPHVLGTILAVCSPPGDVGRPYRGLLQQPGSRRGPCAGARAHSHTEPERSAGMRELARQSSRSVGPMLLSVRGERLFVLTGTRAPVTHTYVHGPRAHTGRPRLHTRYYRGSALSAGMTGRACGREKTKSLISWRINSSTERRRLNKQADTRRDGRPR